MSLVDEARRHFLAGRGIIAFFKDPKDGRKKPVISAKDNSRQDIYDTSIYKLKKYPDTSYLGLICGDESDLSMVDIDCKNGKNGMVMWEQMAAANNHEGLADACCTQTPSGGLHYYFTYTPDLAHGQEKCFKIGDTWCDIDIRNKKTCGFGICSPSPGYTWVRSPFDHPLTKCPQWIIDWHKASTAKPPKVKLEKAAKPKASTTRKANTRGGNRVVVKLASLQSLVLDLPQEACEGYDEWLS
eukprot:36454-Eustigmatos_ZCMA.PRE.1